MNNHRVNNNFNSDHNAEGNTTVNTGHHPLLNTDTVAKANARVTQTKILDKFAAWREEDDISEKSGLVSDRAILVGLMLLAAENSPSSITCLAQLLHYRLTATSRRLLNLPTPNASDPVGERTRWYNRTHAALQRMLALMDPYLRSRSASSFTQVAAVLDAHDVEREAKMKARLREFSDSFLLMTFAQQPRSVRQVATTIDLAISQHFVASPMETGFSRKVLAQKVAEESASGRPSPAFRPVDVSAGWSRFSSADHPRDAGPAVARGNLRWGWMASIAVRVDSANPAEPRFPAIVVAATLSQPGIDIPEDAVHLMRAALGTGLAPGIVHADNAYFATQRVERLHLPTSDLGFTPSADYRAHRLGVQEVKHGAEFIEGKAYCPDMPPALKDASRDFRDGRIPETTYRLRLQERVRFELRPEGEPDDNGRYRMVCPATAGRPEVSRSYGADSRCDGHSFLPGNSPDHLLEHPARKCAQTVITFDRTDGIRERQAFTYKSAQWEAFHQHARSSFEALSAGINQGADGIGTLSRPRVRGFAAAHVFATIVLANYNLLTISRFLQKELRDQNEISSAGDDRPRRFISLDDNVRGERSVGPCED